MQFEVSQTIVATYHRQVVPYANAMMHLEACSSMADLHALQKPSHVELDGAGAIPAPTPLSKTIVLPV